VEALQFHSNKQSHLSSGSTICFLPSCSVVEPKLFVSAPAPTSKSFGSGAGYSSHITGSFVTTFYHRFHIKSGYFMSFMKEYQPNSHARSYTI
jgi:hypothetical protein